MEMAPLSRYGINVVMNQHNTCGSNLHVRLFMQVYCNLQPLNLYMSHMGTINIVNKISEDHDVEVQMWCHELLPLIKKPAQDVS